jgi:ATP-dependent Clp protease ATP-binding subunit ClpA
MLSRNLEQSLHRALTLATERNHEYATLEHLLLALTDDQDSVAVMRACGVQVDQLKKDLTEFIDVELQNLVTPRMAEPKPTASFHDPADGGAEADRVVPARRPARRDPRAVVGP